MTMLRSLVVVLVGCGRIGFDPVGGSTLGDAASPLVEHLPCETPVLLDSGGDLPEDGVDWISEPSGDWLVLSNHVACDVHPIERYAVAVAPGGLAVTDQGAMTQSTHAHTVTLEPVAGGYVLAYVEAYDSTAHTAQVDTTMTVINTRSLGVLGAGNPPLARAGGGGLAMIGVQASVLRVAGIDDTGAPTSVITTLAPSTESPDLPTMVATDTGLAAVWQSGASGRCRVALLDSNLAITAGPVDMTFGTCTAPQIAWLASARRVAVAAVDGSTGGLYAAIWTDTLAPIKPPFRVTTQAISAQIVADADGAWIAWADSSTFALGHARIDASGAATLHPPVAQIDTAVPHYEVLKVVAGDPIAVWIDVAQNRSIAAMRFCP